MNKAKKNKLKKAAAINGVVNAVINGGIQYFFLKGKAPIAISVDSITNTVDTVLAAAVTLGITLALITTVVAYFSTKEKKVAFFPTAFWLTIKHGFFTFGVITSLAVLWQKSMGTIEVSLLPALVIIGVIAGLVSAFVNYLTLKSCIVTEGKK